MEKGTVIIQGDFNARTGNQPDFIARDKSDDPFHMLNYDPPLLRNSEDNKICRSRNFRFLQVFDFLIVNGRKVGDIFGNYTSFQWNGSSVVDYLITSAATIDRISYFKVGKCFPWFSDHCSLFYTMLLQINIPKCETLLEVPPIIKTFPANPNINRLRDHFRRGDYCIFKFKEREITRPWLHN